MKRIFAALFFAIPQLVLAQSPTAELETRLEKTRGADRIAILNELVVVYRESRPDRAVEYGQQALELLTATPDEALEIDLNNSLAIAHLARQDWSEADRLAQKVIALAQTAGRQPELVQAQTSSAHALLGAGDTAAALARFREALKLARAIEDAPGISANLVAIGRIHLTAGRLPAAAETLRRAVAAATQADAARDLQDSLLALSEASARLGNYREAYGALERYDELRRTNESGTHTAVIAELEAALAQERQDREAERSAHQQELEEQRRDVASQSGHKTQLRSAAIVGTALLAVLLLLGWLASRRRARAHARELTERNNRIAEQELALTTAEAKIEAAIASLDESHAELERERFAHNRSSSELTRTSQQLERKSGELERTSEMLERTTVQLAEVSTELKRTVQERDHAATELAEATGSLADTSQQLQQRQSELQASAQQLEETWGELEQLKRSTAKDIAELGDRNASTRQRLSEMERFTSSVAQHLKVLLITIRSSLGALQQDAAAGDIRQLKEDVQRTHAAVGRVVGLLDKLLQLLLVGRIVKTPEEVPMTELAFDAVGQVNGIGQAQVIVAPDMPSVHGDRQQLLEVLHNLLENSCKFMGSQSTPRIEVGSRQTPGYDPVFFVRDNGSGIEPHDQERIFHLFERLDPQQDGVGIGLPLVRRILDNHGGRLWVESEGAGRGSTFFFSLPTSSAAAGG